MSDPAYFPICGTCGAELISEDACRDHQALSCSDGEPWYRGREMAPGSWRAEVIHFLANVAHDLRGVENDRDREELRDKILKFLAPGARFVDVEGVGTRDTVIVPEVFSPAGSSRRP